RTTGVYKSCRRFANGSSSSTSAFDRAKSLHGEVRSASNATSSSGNARTSTQFSGRTGRRHMSASLLVSQTRRGTGRTHRLGRTDREVAFLGLDDDPHVRGKFLRLEELLAVAQQQEVGAVHLWPADDAC